MAGRARMYVWFVVIAGWVLLSPAARAVEPPVAPDAFFRHADYPDLRLSPSGKYIGATVPVRGRLVLAVIDLEARTSNVVAAIAESDIGKFQWVNDDRLVFSTVDLQAGLGEQLGGGLFAIGRDGRDFRELAPTLKKLINMRQFVYRYMTVLWLPRDGTDEILVAANESDAQSPDVYRIDTRTGRKSLLTLGKPGHVKSWVIDRNAAVRAAVVVEKATWTRVYWRPTAEAGWVEIASYGLREPALVPVAFDGDGSLIVASNRGRRTLALFRWNAQTRSLGEMLAGHPWADLTGGLVYDRDKQRIVGVHYDADRPGSAWFDEDWARMQKAIDAVLPDQVNVLQKSGNRVLVSSFSDRDPGRWYLFDPTQRRLEPVGETRKQIVVNEMPRREFVRYKARDGLDIPAIVTLPPKGPSTRLPLVVLVHGGPWVRGAHWQWNAEAAYLASLGYAVIQPDFRGSLGWGGAHLHAGFRQWGRAMQDDLNDGVDYLARKGTVDPSRVCIMGASYGGYAVMMGLARDPERFRCGVNYVGVTDIDLLFDVAWSDMAGSDFLRYSAKEFIGDRDIEGEQLRAVSPLRQAARIRAPVLMAYGAQDRRVPLIHGEKMRDALERQGTPVEWVVYGEEAHGFLLESNRIDFWNRVARFLAQHLAPGRGAATDAPARAISGG